jgi:hypothetical protein
MKTGSPCTDAHNDFTVAMAADVPRVHRRQTAKDRKRDKVGRFLTERARRRVLVVEALAAHVNT